VDEPYNSNITARVNNTICDMGTI